MHHSSSPDPNNTTQQKNNPQPPPSNTGQLLVPSSSFRVPQDPSSLIVKKRAAFKHSRSNTIADQTVRPKSGYLKLLGRSPSFEFGRSQRSVQSPFPSPLPANNPDIVLPTIALTDSEQVIPRRKPLLKESSFLVELHTKTPLQGPLLQSPSKQIPKRGKSAPASPNLSRNSSLSAVSSVSKSYSQDDVRELLEGAQKSGDRDFNASDEENGSCVAEKGEFSDVASSSDFEMFCESEDMVPSKDDIIDGVVKESGGEGSRIEQRYLDFYHSRIHT